MIVTTEYSGGGQLARDQRPGLRMHKVRPQVGAKVNKVPQGVSQVQQPVLEHAEGKGAEKRQDGVICTSW